MNRVRNAAAATAVALTVAFAAGCSGGGHAAGNTASGGAASDASSGVPRYDHVVVVVEENHGYDQIIGGDDAPYENFLARGGVNFTAAYAEHHPSQPNYLELFAGSAYGVSGDDCITDRLDHPSLGGQLLQSGKTFTAYAEGLPERGATECDAGEYARYHNVPLAFSDVPTSNVVPFSRFPGRDYGRLPSVSWVTPNLEHDMHDGSVADGDAWLQHNLSGYATWAASHNSLLVVTFDEDDSDGESGPSHIPTILYGAHLKKGDYKGRINHHTLLAMLEDGFGLPRLGAAQQAQVPPVFTS